MVHREWRVAKPEKEAVAALRAAGFSRVCANLLALRGYGAPEEAKAFLGGDENGDFHDPMALADMGKAVSRILIALQNREKIAVYGDYDADGVTATALLMSYLRDTGADVTAYIPDRETEGYGMNPKACEKLMAQGVRLVITVDTGVSAFEEAKLLAAQKVALIITDHHDLREELPRAYAVVNPKRADSAYPFRELAGVGVAFKLVCAIEQCRDGQTATQLFGRFGELVLLGTVADVVPVLDENRLFVTRGLKLAAEGKNAGVAALLEAAGVKGKRLTATLLSFTAAPRINACGRISSAYDALELLTVQDAQKARTLAASLNENNDERRAIEADILAQTIEKIDGSEALRNSPLLIVSGENWHNGVIGIVAARLVERYGKPAIVVSFEGELGRASCRSIPGFHMHGALCACAQYLERFGGHELAAGFSVRRENYDALYAALNRIANALPELPTLKVSLDLKLYGHEISLSTAREIRAFEPFGSGNQAPLFYVPAAQITAISPVGSARGRDTHLRLTLNCEGFEFSAVMFSAYQSGFEFELSDIVDLAVSLDVNLYKNKETLSVIVRNIRKSACFEYYSGLYRAFLSGSPVRPEALRQRVIPSRDEFSDVFRCLRAKNGALSLEHACREITRRRPRFNYFKLLLIRDVFRETGLIEVSEDEPQKIRYRIVSGVKIDLATSSLLRRIEEKA